MRDDRFTSHRTILGGRGGFLAYGWDKPRQPRSQRKSDDLIGEWIAEQYGELPIISADQLIGLAWSPEG